MFGGVSNLLPISADYSLKSQIGIGRNWVGPPQLKDLLGKDVVFRKAKSKRFGKVPELDGYIGFLSFQVFTCTGVVRTCILDKRI